MRYVAAFGKGTRILSYLFSNDGYLVEHFNDADDRAFVVQGLRECPADTSWFTNGIRNQTPILLGRELCPLVYLAGEPGPNLFLCLQPERPQCEKCLALVTMG